jgi:hypothetical protein
MARDTYGRQRAETVSRTPTAQRPVCGYCGKPLPKDTSFQTFKAGTEPATVEECRRRFNVEVISVRWGKASRYLTAEEIDEHNAKYPALMSAGRPTMSDETRPRVIVSCSTWSGGYTGYGPFCTLRCAANFGVASHRAGYRVTK